MARELGIWIGIFLVIILIIYTIVLLYTYREQKWIFAPYDRPPLKDGFQPNGAVSTDLTPAQQERRKIQLLGPQAAT